VVGSAQGVKKTQSVGQRDGEGVHEYVVDAIAPTEPHLPDGEVDSALLVAVEGAIGTGEQLPKTPAQSVQHGSISSLLKAMARMSAR
jgi:hypothetical protein